MNPIEQLSQRIREAWPNTKISTPTRPRDAHGVWWLDVDNSVANLSIQWHPEAGIGVSRTSSPSYGEGPDRTFSTVDAAERRILRLLNPIYLAIDTPDRNEARDLIQAVDDFIGGIKIGLTFWFANDRSVVYDLVGDHDWFLDVKLYDIPVQVAGAIRAVINLQPTFISLHTGEFKENANEDERRREEMMMLMAKHAIEQQAGILRVPQPRLLAVTVPTHLPATPTQVLAKAQRAISCGMDGVIASPLEVGVLRSELGTKPVLMTPGIRNGTTLDEQHRTGTAKQAVERGANYLVIGRPITEAADPREAAERIRDSLR